MKTTVRFLFLLLAIASLFVITYAGNIINEKPVAYSSGGDIVIRWTTVNEAGVIRFDVLRRAGTSGDFTVIGSVDQLKGNNSTYEYVDRSVFKITSGIYEYKIRIINGQNPPPETDFVSVLHTSSTAKRTWGSIKAMFR